MNPFDQFDTEPAGATAASNPATSLEGDIERRRRELKLAEAERRCA